MRVFSVCLGLCALSGCAVASGPVVSMFNGESVNVQSAPVTHIDADNATARAMANRVCGKRGQYARHAATRTVSDHVWEYLYRCR